MLAACAGKHEKTVDQVSARPLQTMDNMAQGIKVFSRDGRTRLSRERFSEILLDADYVLVGERHDSEEQHKAQLFVLESLSKDGHPGKRIALGLEMLPFTEQPRLNALQSALKGKKSKVTLREFARKVNWEGNWGYDAELYSAPLNFALAHGIPIFGLNASQAMVKAARQYDIADLNRLSGKEKLALGLPEDLQLPELILPTESQQARLRLIFNSHMERMRGGASPVASPAASPVASPVAPSGMASDGSSGQKRGRTSGRADGQPSGISPAAPPDAAPDPELEARFTRFMRIQSLWDTVMAWQAVKARATIQGPLVILAGAGHVEYGWGIAERLRHMRPDAGIVLLLPTQQLVRDGAQSLPLLPDPAPGRKRNRPAADYYLLCKADAPDTEQPGRMTGSENVPGIHKGRLGIRLALPGTTEQKRSGLEILEVRPGSRAEAAGIKGGDFIIRADNKTVKSVMDLHQAGKSAAAAGRALKLLLKRDGKNVIVDIPAAK